MKLSFRFRYLKVGFSLTHECPELYSKVMGTWENSQHMLLSHAYHSIP